MHTIADVADPDASWVYDIDGDGKLDVVTSYHSGSTPGYLSWFQQGPTRDTWTEHHIAAAEAVGQIQGIVAADFDGDGIVEVIAASQLDGKLYLFKPAGDPTSGWTQTTLRTGKPYVHDVAPWDVDGDGRPECFYSWEGYGATDGGVGVLKFTSGDVTDPANWLDHVIVAVPGGWGLCRAGLADLTGSGRGDLLFTARAQRNPNATPGVYIAQRPPTWSDPWPVLVLDNTSWTDPGQCDLGDYFGNGADLDPIVHTDSGVVMFDHVNGYAQSLVGGLPTGPVWNVRTWPAKINGRSTFFTIQQQRAASVGHWTGSGWAFVQQYPVTWEHPADGWLHVAPLDGTPRLVVSDSGGNKLYWVEVMTT